MNEELLEHVREYQKSKSDESFEAIIAALKPIIHYYAKQFFAQGNDEDDMRQEARFAIFRLLPDYDESRGTFRSFARLAIRRHLITILKRSKNNRNKPLGTAVSIDAPLDDYNEEETYEGNIIARENPDTLERREEMDELLRPLRRKCTKMERKVLDAYIKSDSYLEIAKIIRRDSKATDNAVERLKLKARRILDEKESTEPEENKAA